MLIKKKLRLQGLEDFEAHRIIEGEYFRVWFK